jgi:hypothetical protein
MNTAYLVNITSQQWVLERTYGLYVIRGTQDGEPYAVTHILPRLMRRDRGDKQEELTPLEAWSIAEDLAMQINRDAGEDSFLGVFASATPVPEAAALEEARSKLAQFYAQLVVAADGEWERAHNHLLISDLHRRAARFLGIEKEWAYDPKPLVDCPACGAKIKPEVAVCRECHAILDREKALRFGLVEEVPPPSGEIPRPAQDGRTRREEKRA